MKQTSLIMGMPITVKIIDPKTKPKDIREVFNYFKLVDARFSPYKKDSEISKINQGLPQAKWSKEVKSVLKLCEKTKQQTNGYFDISHKGKIDPSGLVKGWAIFNAAKMLKRNGFKNFYIDAGGDIQVSGSDEAHEPWIIGIRNPFNIKEIIKTLAIKDQGIATSGKYIRGDHIYNPLNPKDKLNMVKSLTVIGPNVYEADRFATAAYAMGISGIKFIESLMNFEAYMVTEDKMATYTSGFERYLINA